MTGHHEGEAKRGWVFYDAECPMCTRLTARMAADLRARGFDRAPLQDPWVRQRLGLSLEQLLAEMRVLARDGRTLGGADAVVYLAREVRNTTHWWWAWPFTVVSRMPFGMRLLRYGYRRVAARRHCRKGVCAIATEARVDASTPNL